MYFKKKIKTEFIISILLITALVVLSCNRKQPVKKPELTTQEDINLFNEYFDNFWTEIGPIPNYKLRVHAKSISIYDDEGNKKYLV